MEAFRCLRRPREGDGHRTRDPRALWHDGKLGHVALERDRRSLLTTDPLYSGPSERDYSEETAAILDEEVRKIVENAFDRTVALLEERRPFWSDRQSSFWSVRQSERMNCAPSFLKKIVPTEAN
jgi:hypothetical protein